MRTFDRETFLRAQREWSEGRFGWEWEPVRRIAADRGFILPPHGTVHDDRDAENPSQRAIIYRALAENPIATEAIVRRAHSWSQVVDGIIGLEKRLAEDADELDRDITWRRKDEIGPRDATLTLKAILNRIGDS